MGICSRLASGFVGTWLNSCPSLDCPVSTRSYSILVPAGLVTVQAQSQDTMKTSLEVVRWAVLGPKRPIPWLEWHKLVSEHPLHHRQRPRSAPWFPGDVYTSAALGLKRSRSADCARGSLSCGANCP